METNDLSMASSDGGHPLDIEQERIRRKVRQALVGAPSAGLHVGRFELKSRLGAGAMGLVYEAHDPTLDRVVALKVLDDAAGSEQESEEHRERRQRLLREARALALLRHPNVVPIYEAGEDLGHVYIVMERVQGAELSQWLARAPRSPEQIIRVLCGAGRGLAAAHEKGLVHRDVKPSNIMVDLHDQARLVDFGLVRAQPQAGAPVEQLTRTGAGVGTPDYMAPEQLRAERADTRTDQYGFCVTLYEALCEERPFASDSAADQIERMMTSPPAPPKVPLPKAVWPILQRGLAARRDDRFASMSALIDALQLSLQDTTDTIGEYHLGPVLGAGGSGVVYRARSKSSGREVALKRLFTSMPRSAAVDPSRAIPGLVEIIEQVQADPPYVVMELIEGETIAQRLNKGPMDPHEVMSILRQLGSTLSALHQAGVVHRDVKPSNLMVQPDGRVILLDLGSCQRIDEASDSGEATTAYAPPEQLKGEPTDARADQFSLAVTAQRMLTGEQPWPGEALALVTGVLSETPTPASTQLTTLPKRVDEVLAKALSRERAARFQSIDRFVGALGDALEPRRSAGAWLGLAAGLSALIAVGALLWSAPGPVVAGETIACPLFEVKGLERESGWLGAAAANLACMEAQWLMGGDTARILKPAQLLEFPVLPNEQLPPFPYAKPGLRERSIERARNADAVIHGLVRVDLDGFEVTLRLDDHRASGRAKRPWEAVHLAFERLRERGAFAPPPKLDPQVARWLPNDDPQLARLMHRAALETTDGSQPLKACRALFDNRDLKGIERFAALRRCANMDVRFREPAPAIDRTSPSGLVNTALAQPPSEADSGLIQALSTAQNAAHTSLARARLAHAEGTLLQRQSRDEEAHPRFLSALSHEPTWCEARMQYFNSARKSSGKAGVRALVSWCPWVPGAWTFLSWYGLSEQSERLEAERRAYLLGGRAPQRLMTYVYELLRAGKIEDAKSALSALEPGAHRTDVAAAVAVSMIDATEARFTKATRDLERVLSQLPRLGYRQSAAINALFRLRRLSTITGERRAVGDWFAKTFVVGPPGRLPDMPGFYDLPMIGLCMYAEPNTARACLDRIQQAQGDDQEGDGARYLGGARALVEGDLKGAVERWRPLVRLGRYAINLPAEVFDQAGEPELAIDCDAMHKDRNYYGGIGFAHARNAQRAATSGDIENARSLAREVIKAWGAADSAIPAVQRMRALLKTLPKTP